MRRFSFLICSLAAMAALPMSLHAASVSYDITPIAPLAGDNYSAGWSINNSDQVVGVSSDLDFSNLNTTGTNIGEGFFYSNGTATQIPGINGASVTLPFSINDSGLVVGLSIDPGSKSAAVTYQNGVVTSLASIIGSAFPSAAAAGVNASGEIVGEANNGGTPSVSEAFSLAGGTFQPIGIPQGDTSSAALAVNSSGEIVGFSGTKSSGHGFIYSNGTFQILAPLPGDAADLATAINDQGNVVGISASAGAGNASEQAQLVALASGLDGEFAGMALAENSHAFLYDAATKTLSNIGSFGGTSTIAEAINNSNDIVGFSDDASGNYSAFLDTGSGIVNLNSLIPAGSGWTLLSAEDINNNGDIVGFGELDGNFEGFILTPSNTNTGGNGGTGNGGGTGNTGGSGNGSGNSGGTSAVPLPSALASGSIMLAGLAFISRLKSRRAAA
jgi:probable HAF family extracellular repeat protein